MKIETLVPTFALLALASLAPSLQAQTTVANKTTTEDHTANTTPASLGALTLYGTSEFLDKGNAGTVVTDAATSLVLEQAASNGEGGDDTIDLAGTGANLTLTVGAITRTAGSIVDFVTSNTGTGVSTIKTTTALNTGTALSYWALYDGNDWAAGGGGSAPGAAVTSGASEYNNAGADSTALALSSWTATNQQGFYLTDNASATYSGTIGVSAQVGGMRFQNTSGAAITIGSGQTLTTNAILIAQGAGAVTYTGGTLLGSGTPDGSNNNPELAIEQENTAQTLTISSNIGSATAGTAITKAGAGTVTLTGTDLPGTSAATQEDVRVTDGRLNNNGTLGSSAHAINALYVLEGATYGGTGTVSSLGTAILGNLSPGTGTTASLGTMTFNFTNSTALLTFEGPSSSVPTAAGTGSTMTYDINGTNSDRVDFTGTAGNHLAGGGNATLDINAVNISTSTNYIVFENANSGFTFANIVNPAGYTSTFTYETTGPDADDYVLAFTQIPEPSAFALLVGGLGGLGFLLRRKGARFAA